MLTPLPAQSVGSSYSKHLPGRQHARPLFKEQGGRERATASTYDLMFRVGREEAGLLSLTLHLFTSLERMIFKLGNVPPTKEEAGVFFK